MRKMLMMCFLILLCAGMGLAQTYPDREKEVRAILEEKDPFAREGKSVFFLRQLDFGIPGGENWFARWSEGQFNSSRSMVMYAVNGTEIVERFRFEMGDVPIENPDLGFDILENIPGIRIPGGNTVLGDYNGDGFYEVLNLPYNDRGVEWSPRLVVEGYDTEDNLRSFFITKFIIVPDLSKGPHPIEFLNYQGKSGFKIFENAQITDGPKKGYRGEIWNFYAWDPQVREYVKQGEYKP